jgi:hypothetical protein
MSRVLRLGPFSLPLPAGWALDDPPEEHQGTLVLTRQGGRGQVHLQLATWGMPLQAITSADLDDLIDGLGSQLGLGEPDATEHDDGPPARAGARFHDDGSVLWAWYLAQGDVLAQLTWRTPWPPHADEHVEVHEMVRSAKVAKDASESAE